MPTPYEKSHNEITTAHSLERQKYIYFLLAVAASAVAFSMKLTATMLLSWPLSLVAISVLCWSGSFYCGCAAIKYKLYSLAGDAFDIKLKLGVNIADDFILRPGEEDSIEFKKLTDKMRRKGYILCGSFAF
jgi:hypothetical protein